MKRTRRSQCWSATLAIFAPNHLEPFLFVPLKKMAFFYRPLKSSDLLGAMTLYFFVPQAIMSIFAGDGVNL
jgi:hypothetical protein